MIAEPPSQQALPHICYVEQSQRKTINFLREPAFSKNENSSTIRLVYFREKWAKPVCSSVLLQVTNNGCGAYGWGGKVQPFERYFKRRPTSKTALTSTSRHTSFFFVTRSSASLTHGRELFRCYEVLLRSFWDDCIILSAKFAWALGERVIKFSSTMMHPLIRIYLDRIFSRISVLP